MGAAGAARRRALGRALRWRGWRAWRRHAHKVALRTRCRQLLRSVPLARSFRTWRARWAAELEVVARLRGLLALGARARLESALGAWLDGIEAFRQAAARWRGIDRSVARGAAATAWRAWRDAACLASSLAALGARMKQAANPAPVPNPNP